MSMRVPTTQLTMAILELKKSRHSKNKFIWDVNTGTFTYHECLNMALNGKYLLPN